MDKNSNLSKAKLVFDYAALGQPFVVATPTTPLKNTPQLVHLNTGLAQALGIAENCQSPEGLQTLTGNQAWPGYPSLASVYCGHQFGVFVPQLGDGRALLLAELQTPVGYQQLQLKGAGPTPFSRQGDGRAVLRSSIREYLASEAMHALGVPTTRALSLVTSADPIRRETRETAAVVCRVAPSFLRFGHVEFFAYRHTGQTSQQNSQETSPHPLRTLLAWHLYHQHPELGVKSAAHLNDDVLLVWLRGVVHSTASLLAQWQALGFCHGVMNTDNMSLLGLTLDYGPYGFMERFNAQHICNHSDTQGRYSYHNQPRIAHWNLYALGQALSVVLNSDADTLRAVLDEFIAVFENTHQNLSAKKLGFNNAQMPAVQACIQSTWALLHAQGLDMTRFFRSLCALNPKQTFEHNWPLWAEHPHSVLYDRSAALPASVQAQREEALQGWLRGWLAAHQALGLAQNHEAWQHTLQHTNPAFVLRNHLLQQAIEKAEHGHFNGVADLFTAAQNPWQDPKDELWIQPPPPHACIEVSCSS